MPLRILTAADIKKVLPMQDAITALKDAFLQLAEGNAYIPLRTVIPISKQEAATFCMPAYTSSSGQLGVKIVSSFPRNVQEGLPTIHGIVILLNSRTGQVEALLDGSYLTALRTGAASGLATDLLAKPEASSVAIIGSGAQAKTQLEAIQCVRKINQIWLYSPTRSRTEQFAQEINPLSAHITITNSVYEATQDADIICTATPATSPILDILDVKRGAHINAIGSHSSKMRELSSNLISEAMVVVDQRTAALSEAGEIIESIQAGTLQADNLFELGNIIQEPSLGRSNLNQITVFKSVGLAIQDVSTAEKAFKAALEMKQGSVVEI